MVTFDEIWAKAVVRHGENDVVRRLPSPKTGVELAATPDDRFLAAMTKRVFAAGFRWRVIEAKWQGFEEAFGGFDPRHVASLDGAAIDALAQDTRIVRNRPKILSTVANAGFVERVSAEHGGFGTWLADWPVTDTVGLWEALKSGGDRLGGDTGAWFLRLVGKDSFRLSSDVVGALIAHGVIDKPPTGKRAKAAVQEAFNAWHAETGRPMGALSVVLACTHGEVYAARH